MAKAPKVKPGGHEAAKVRQERAKEVYRVEVADVLSFTYAPWNVPIRVRARIRDEFRMSLEEWLFNRGEVDVSTYADVWWVARMAQGENVSRDEVFAEWDELCEGVSREDITDKLVESDDFPEA